MNTESLSIAEASILFYSHHYKNLKCKVVEKITNIVLCCKLINNCIETIFNINRDLEEFIIELSQDGNLVGVFSFTYEDLDKIVSHDSSKDARSKKYIKFVKENDCCSLYFTIESKDIIYADHHEAT